MFFDTRSKNHSCDVDVNTPGVLFHILEDQKRTACSVTCSVSRYVKVVIISEFPVFTVSVHSVCLPCVVKGHWYVIKDL